MAGVCRGRIPSYLSTGSHHGERCADNVLAASGARPSSTTHYSPGVISSSRAGRQLEGRYAHGVQVCGLRERGERERERGRTERQRERGEDLSHSACFSAHHFRAISFHSDCIRNHLNSAHPFTCLCLGVLTRACSARVGCARGLRACVTSERERERSRSRRK